MHIRIDTAVKNEWLYDHPVEVYHADNTAISSTLLKTMLKSPHTFLKNYTGQVERKETKEMELGKLIHKAVLEGSDFIKNFIVLPDFGDQRSSKNREAKKEFMASLSPTAIPITLEEEKKIMGVAESIMGHETAVKILKDGKSELTGYFQDPITKLKCRIRPDFLSFNLNTLVDLKTTTNCERDFFSGELWRYRYDFQFAFYRMGIEAISGKKPEFEAIIAVEKQEPYEVAVYFLEQSVLDIGEKDVRRALNRLKHCLETKDWARYQKAAMSISVPHWVVNKLASEESYAF